MADDSLSLVSVSESSSGTSCWNNESLLNKALDLRMPDSPLLVVGILLLVVVLVLVAVLLMLILLNYLCSSRRQQYDPMSECGHEEEDTTLGKSLDAGESYPPPLAWVDQLNSPLRYVIQLEARDLARLVFQGKSPPQSSAISVEVHLSAMVV